MQRNAQNIPVALVFDKDVGGWVLTGEKVLDGAGDGLDALGVGVRVLG
jgi:hypothetical protein